MLGLRRSVRCLAGALGLVIAGAPLALVTPASAALLASPARTWGVDGRVNIILPVGDRVFIGGTFSAVIDVAGATTPVSNLAAYDPATGRFDVSWRPTVNDAVTALAASPDGARLYIGGAFNRVNGATRPRLAALSTADGTVDAAWAPVPDLIVDSLATAGSDVYAGGLFTSIADRTGTYPRPYVARLDGVTGELDRSFAPTPNDRVRAVATAPGGGRVYLGGAFTSVSGAPRTNKIASVLPSGAVDSGFAAVPNNRTNFAEIIDLTTDGTSVVQAVAGSGGACTAVNAATGALRWTKRANGNLQSVRLAHGMAYCGGHFGGATGFDGLARQKLAAVDLASGTTTPFAPRIDSALGTWAVGVDAGSVYVGGDFTTISGVPQPHFARFPLTQSAPLAPRLSASGDDGVVHLTWSPPSSDGGAAVRTYRVYRQLAAGTYPSRPLATVTGAFAYDDAAVSNGTPYTYRITAVNAVGEGSASTEARATPGSTVATPPSAPRNVTATAGPRSVRLAWSAPANAGSSPLTSYVISRGTAPGDLAPIGEVAPTVTSYTDGTVRAGTTYYYAIRAGNSAGSSASSAEVAAVPTPGAPDPVQNLRVVSSAPGTVTLAWDPPAYDGGSAITRYRIIRDQLQYATAGPTATSYTDSSPIRSRTYTYQVKTINAVGASSLATVSVTTGP